MIDLCEATNWRSFWLRLFDALIKSTVGAVEQLYYIKRTISFRKSKKWIKNNTIRCFNNNFEVYCHLTRTMMMNKPISFRQKSYDDEYKWIQYNLICPRIISKCTVCLWLSLQRLVIFQMNRFNMNFNINYQKSVKFLFICILCSC